MNDVARRDEAFQEPLPITNGQVRLSTASGLGIGLSETALKGHPYPLIDVRRWRGEDGAPADW